MLQLLADHPYIVMDEHFEGNEDRTEEPEADVDVKVWGNVVAFVERLDDEHFKSLQVGALSAFLLSLGKGWFLACGMSLSFQGLYQGLSPPCSHAQYVCMCQPRQSLLTLLTLDCSRMSRCFWMGWVLCVGIRVSYACHVCPSR